MTRAILSNLGRAALDAFFPRTCVLCGELIASGPSRASSPDAEGGRGRPACSASPLCRACAESLVPISGPRCRCCGSPLISELATCMRCRGRDWAFDAAYPLFLYDGAFKRLLSAYKFGGRRSLAAFFAERFAESLQDLWPGRPLVPVPPRPGKLAERGWDQVEEIARSLERRGFDIVRILERRSPAQQKRLGRAARLENARSAYNVRERAAVPPELVLIDDVVTTCATAQACAAALRAAGARSVSVLALAAD